MKLRTPAIDELLLAIHSVALAEDGWDKLISDVSLAVGASSASLVTMGHHPSVKPSSSLLELDPALVKRYADHWGQQDAWYLGAVRTGRIGVGLVNVDSQLIDYAEFKRTAFRNEYLRPLNIDRMMGIYLAGPTPRNSMVAMTFYRGKGRECFSAEKVELLHAIAPHLTLASENYWAAQSLRALLQANDFALDTLTSAVFGIDSRGVVRLTNQAADDLLRLRRWVEVSQGVLRPTRNVIDADALAKALAGASAGGSFRRVVSDAPTGTRAIISGAPCPRTQALWHPGCITALVWINVLAPAGDATLDLVKLFRLTPAERRLVDRMVAGDGLREAAQHLSISFHTARSQIKSVFAKTGFRSQAALLTFVTQLSVVHIPAR
jgi:DNA-binding CsgD family transcriptional regulator